MRWCDILTERHVPDTDYGYWITAEGEIVPVEHESHDRTSRRMGTNYGLAMQDGWIRLVVEIDVLCINFVAGAIKARAISALKTVAKSKDFSGFRVTVEGRISRNQFFDTFSAAMRLVSRTSATAVAQYTNDEWKEMSKPIVETFNHSVTWGWGHKTDFYKEIKFKVARRPYTLILSGSPSMTGITFQDDKLGQGITGEGNAAKVFGAVLNILIPYLNTAAPERFAFECRKNQPSRLKLYRTMVRVLADKLPGYAADENDDGSKEVIWTFTRL